MTSGVAIATAERERRRARSAVEGRVEVLVIETTKSGRRRPPLDDSGGSHA